MQWARRIQRMLKRLRVRCAYCGHAASVVIGEGAFGHTGPEPMVATLCARCMRHGIEIWEGDQGGYRPEQYKDVRVKADGKEAVDGGTG